MPDILLIYDASDAVAVDRLADAIAQAGITVAKLAPTIEMVTGPDYLFREIEDARAVVVVWSPRSVASQVVPRCADLALKESKLVPLRTHDLDPTGRLTTFGKLHMPLVDDWDAIGEAISLKFDENPAGGNDAAAKSATGSLQEMQVPAPVAATPSPPSVEGLKPTLAAPPTPAPVAAPASPVAEATPAPIAPVAAPAAPVAPTPAAAAPMPAVATSAPPIAPPVAAAPPPPMPTAEPAAPPPPPPPPRPRTEGIGAAASAPRPRVEGVGAASEGLSRHEQAWRFQLGKPGTGIRFDNRVAPTPRPPSLTVDAMQQARGTTLADAERLAALRTAMTAPREAPELHDMGRLMPASKPMASGRSGGSGGSAWILGLSASAVAIGFAYLFRDTIAQNADRLLAILGLAKGTMPALPGLTPHPVVVVDDVDCSVFAPPAAEQGTRIMVQVFLHRIEQAERAQFLAQTMDDTAKLRGVQTLQMPIQRRTTVQIDLDGRGLNVIEPVQRVLWNGEPTVASFEVEVPLGFKDGVCHPLARMTIDGEPVGRILFQIRIEPATRDARPLQAQEFGGVAATHYKHAFLSYASKDRAEVLKRAQAFQAAKLEFFQDVLSLEPGQRYSEEILRRIDKSDLFVLFWSRNAMRSQWVQKEIDRALACQRDDPSGLPDIVPIMLEPIAKAPPPPGLEHLHLNAPINTLIAAEQPSLLRRIMGKLFG